VKNVESLHFLPNNEIKDQFWPQKEAIIYQTTAPILVTDGGILSVPIKLKIQNDIWAKSQLDQLKMCDTTDCQRHTATMPRTKHCYNLKSIIK
jgi:hypothetical protein